ncbi:MAG: hypothetical protein WCT01_02985 [Candidatus Shapirobacteria bacterium]
MAKEIIRLLKTLPPETWNLVIDNKWTIKEIVAHFVGWEEECVSQLPLIWQNQRTACFLFLDEVGDAKFNQESLEKYAHLSPTQLLTEWEKWLKQGEKTVQEIDENNMKTNPKLFSWWFDQSHYQGHYDQIRKALEVQ